MEGKGRRLILIKFFSPLFFSFVSLLYRLFSRLAAEKTGHNNVIVFYDEENKESAEYLADKMDNRDNYVTKKYRVDFDGSKSAAILRVRGRPNYSFIAFFFFRLLCSPRRLR